MKIYTSGSNIIAESTITYKGKDIKFATFIENGTEQEVVDMHLKGLSDPDAVYESLVQLHQDMLVSTLSSDDKARAQSWLDKFGNL